MSLKSKVQTAVNTAFDKLKDLSVTATFDNKIVSGFDFESGAITSDEQSYTTIGFLEDKKSFVNGTPVTKTTLTVKTVDGVDFNRYTEVTINEVVYNCNMISKNDFVVILSLSGD